jgi:diadenosine tetraphosphate (Ap4A) HIT family hydrolase
MAGRAGWPSGGGPWVRAYPGRMPMSPEEFYAHAMQAADAEGRLPLSRMTGWDVFPFEQSGLRAVPLVPPVLPEPARAGENAADCPACAAGREPVWSDEHWRLSVLGPSGAPLILLLEPTAHYDLPDLPDDLAGEMGLLTVRIARAIEALPHIARAHVSRWGDGAAHLHIFFFARPEGFRQLRGTCLAVWDDLLPAVPDEQRDRDAAAVAQTLAGSHGGRAHARP